MSTNADSVVLVVWSGQTTRQALRRARDLLVRVNARSRRAAQCGRSQICGLHYYYEYRGKYGTLLQGGGVEHGPEPVEPDATPRPASVAPKPERSYRCLSGKQCCYANPVRAEPPRSSC